MPPSRLAIFYALFPTFSGVNPAKWKFYKVFSKRKLQLRRPSRDNIEKIIAAANRTPIGSNLYDDLYLTASPLALEVIPYAEYEMTSILCCFL